MPTIQIVISITFRQLSITVAEVVNGTSTALKAQKTSVILLVQEIMDKWVTLDSLLAKVVSNVAFR